MPTKEKTKEWRKDLRALLNAADGLLAQLREGDGLFVNFRDSEDAHKWGRKQILYRVGHIKRAKNGALRLAFAKPLNIHPRVRVPALEMYGLGGRFVPDYCSDKPPLLHYDEREATKSMYDMVRFEKYHFYDVPVPDLWVAGVSLHDLSVSDRTFDSVEALQNALNQYSGSVIARIRPGEVKVLLTNTSL